MPIIGDIELPIHPDPDKQWSAEVARQKLRKWASRDGTGLPTSIDYEKYSKAFLWRDDEEGDGISAYKLPYAEPANEKPDAPLEIIAHGVKAIAAGHGVGGMAGDTKEIEQRICKLYAAVKRRHPDFPVCPFPRGKRKPLTSAAGNQTHSGVTVMAMVSAADAERMAWPNGEPPESLHITLAHAPDASVYDETVKQGLLAALGETWNGKPIVSDAFATAQFNPENGMESERPRADVLLTQSGELAELRDWVVAATESSGVELSQDFPVWIPHVTTSYGEPDPAAKATLGEFMIDRLVVSWAGEMIEVGTMNAMSEPVTAAVHGSTDLPVADRDHGWNGDAASARMFKRAEKPDGSYDTEMLWDGFLWQDGDPQMQGSWKLPIADVIDGTLTLIPAAVAATAGGHGVNAVKGVSDEDRSSLQTKVCSLYSQIRNKFEDWPECPFSDDSDSDERVENETKAEREAYEMDDAMTASAGSGQVFDYSDFDEPQFTGVTPFTYYPETGIVEGHVAAAGSCHLDYKGQCQEPPPSPSNYSRFHVHGARMTDGKVLPVGVITLGPGHESRGNLVASRDHYANVSTIAAKVRAGSDQFGTWVRGKVLDTVENPDDLLLSPLSGHWEPDPEQGHQLEMIAAHVVVTPGYYVPRQLVAAGGDDTASYVVASTGLTPEKATTVGVNVSLANLDAVKEAVVAALDEREARNAREARYAPVKDRARKERVEQLMGRI